MRPLSSRPWRRALCEESGQALVLAIAIVVVGLALGLGAVAYALNSGQASSHDEHTRQAQQAADAGVQASLFQEAGAAAVGYNVGSGTVGDLLACTIPKINSTTDRQVGTAAFSVTVGNGGCPSAVNSSGDAITNPWLPLSNGSYYESAFFPNSVPQVGSAGSSAYSIQFPEVVGIGCNTLAASGASDCAGNASGTSHYARDFALLDPTAPLQAIEAGNNVYLSGGSLNETQCLQVLSDLSLTNTASCLLTGNTAMILNGTLAAGYDIQLPSVLLGVNTNGSVATTVSYLTSSTPAAYAELTQSITGLIGTLDYGNAYNDTSVSPGPTDNSGGSYTTSGTPIATVANIVHATGGRCVAGQPANNCTLARPTFTLSGSQPLTGSTGMSGSGYSSPSTGSEAGDLTMGSGGTLTLAAGTYVFCNVDITGGTLIGPSTGAAQIFVLQPGAPQCPAGGGNFIDTPGITPPSSLSATVNALTTVVNPSTVQIYVAGNPGDKLVVGQSTAPTTSVQIGDTGTTASQAAVIYAPRSNVSVSTTATFVGSVVGWNVTMAAMSVIQDLNLGNYPLASVVNGIRVHQNVECSNAVTQLAPSTSTTAESTDTAGCT